MYPMLEKFLSWLTTGFTRSKFTMRIENHIPSMISSNACEAWSKMQLGANKLVRRPFRSAYKVRTIAGQKCASFTSPVRASAHSMQNLKYLLSLSIKNQANLRVIQQSILAVSLDSHTLGLCPRDNIHTSPTPPATKRPRRSTATCTTFVPPLMPVTGGSTKVTPSSPRRTPARGRWANIHLSMPLCPVLSPTTPSHNLSFPKRSLCQNLRFLPTVILILLDGRDWTGSQTNVSRRNVSLPNLAPESS
jgi:hypothetical protein